MGFWNQEGAFIFASNMSKGYGNVASRKRLLRDTFDQYLLGSIEEDARGTARSFVKNTGREWTVIRLYDHIAIHNEYNERVMMIKFNWKEFETQ